MRGKLIFSVSVLLILGSVLLVFNQTKISSIFFNNFGTRIPSQGKIMGIDVSHHQGKIDWTAALKMKINKDSIQFVYLKVSEGVNFKDPLYNYNRRELDQHKVKVGVYHFYSADLDPIEQANYFVNRFKRTSLKPVVDVEQSGGLTKIELIENVGLFMKQVDKMIGVKPIIYTYESFYQDYFKGSKLDQEFFWLAAYKRKCVEWENPHVIAWQFSEKGTINGIIEKVDLNKAKGSFWQYVIWK